MHKLLPFVGLILFQNFRPTFSDSGFQTRQKLEGKAPSGVGLKRLLLKAPMLTTLICESFDTLTSIKGRIRCHGKSEIQQKFGRCNHGSNHGKW